MLCPPHVIDKAVLTGCFQKGLFSKGSWKQKANEDQINEDDQICVPYKLRTNTLLWLILLRQSMRRKTAWRECQRGSLWRLPYLWHAGNTWTLENCMLTVNYVLTISFTSSFLSFQSPFFLSLFSRSTSQDDHHILKWLPFDLVLSYAPYLVEDCRLFCISELFEKNIV